MSSRLSLWIPFFLALFFFLWGTAFFPSLRVWAFIPFLAIAYYRISFLSALWLSFWCGLFLDIFSSQLRFGLFSFAHMATCSLLYVQKKHFFEDKPLALSCYTTFFSLILSTLIALFSFWSHELRLSLSFFFSDVILMSFIDGAYAFFWFTCPLSLIVYLKRHGLKNLFPNEEG